MIKEIKTVQVVLDGETPSLEEIVEHYNYHLGFQFGVACAILDVIPDVSGKNYRFQRGFTGGFAAAASCMELRVCSKVGMKDFIPQRDRKRRFTHEPKIEGRAFYNRTEEETPKTGTRSKARRANR